MRFQLVLMAALGCAISVGCADMCRECGNRQKAPKAQAPSGAKMVQIEQSQVPVLCLHRLPRKDRDRPRYGLGYRVACQDDLLLRNRSQRSRREVLSDEG